MTPDRLFLAALALAFVLAVAIVVAVSFLGHQVIQFVRDFQNHEQCVAEMRRRR